MSTASDSQSRTHRICDKELAELTLVAEDGGTDEAMRLLLSKLGAIRAYLWHTYGSSEGDKMFFAASMSVLGIKV